MEQAVAAVAFRGYRDSVAAAQDALNLYGYGMLA